LSSPTHSPTVTPSHANSEIHALWTFDLVYVTTAGGPGDATSVPALKVYELAFRGGQVGAAAAIGLTLAAIIFLIVIGIDRLAERGMRT